jgi:hypothetical protein
MAAGSRMRSMSGGYMRLATEEQMIAYAHMNSPASGVVFESE